MLLNTKGLDFLGDAAEKRLSDPLWAAVPSDISYPSHGIFSPFEALRLVALVLFQHIEDALRQVEKYAKEQKELPLTEKLSAFRGYFFAPRPIVEIPEKDFPAVFITLSNYASTTKSITGVGKAKTDAKFSLMITAALKERDPDIQVIKACRYIAAVEYLIADVFLNPSYALTPSKNPFQYLDVDLESFQWAITTSTEIQPGLSATVGSLGFDLRKRVM